MAQATGSTAPLGALHVDPKQLAGITSDETTYRDLRTAEVKKLVKNLLRTLDLSSLNPKPSPDGTSEKAKQAIERILACKENAHAEILGVSQDATKADVLAAWRELGCLVQPYMKDKASGDAFCRLIKAAKELGVDLFDIDEVLFWDGKEDLTKSDETDGVQATEDEVAAPPERVQDIYEKATPHLVELALNPQNKEALDKISQLNYEIIEGNKAEGLTKAGIYQWKISTSFFVPQYNEALTRYNAIAADPANTSASEEIDTLKLLIDEVIERNHYPVAWSVPTADHYRKAKQAIERIMGCSTSGYSELLGVGRVAPEEEVLAAWRTLGCLIHPTYSKQKNAEEAFERLRKAAEEEGLDDLDIEEVVQWDGKDDLHNQGEDHKPVEDSLPMPPEWVRKIYESATPDIAAFQADSGDGMVQSKLDEFNEEIKQGKIKDGKTEAEADIWEIPTSFFKPHYASASEAFEVLKGDPTNAEARNKVISVKTIIDAKIMACHLPEVWTIQAVGDNLKEVQEYEAEHKKKDSKKQQAQGFAEEAKNAGLSAEAFVRALDEKLQAARDEATKGNIETAKVKAAAEATKAKTATDREEAAARKALGSSVMADVVEGFESARDACVVAKAAEKAAGAVIAALEASLSTSKAGTVKYPWPTMETEDGHLIVGLRQRGRIGHKVCFEVEEADGRLVRKLVAGADAGLLDVARYKKLDGYKNLAEGQSQWTYKDREDFEELLFVTESKRKSIYGNVRDPAADCCVKFRSKGIRMLIVSSLVRVLGQKLTVDPTTTS